jgi:uncharacterized protein (DUF488 family)
MRATIHTVGHSTRSTDEFVHILKSHGVAQLIDIRTIPKSARNPQFGQEALRTSLNAAGIRYTHLPGLGGLRKPRPDSINTGWRNTSFRGYADYMQTDAFRKNLEQLIELAAVHPTAIMCAEAVPWRCHRSLVADALTARNFQVIDILSETKAQPHAVTPLALVKGDQVTYPKLRDDSNLQLDLDLSARQ